jgi:TolA-binding protein
VNSIWQHIIDQLPAIITALGGAWAVIHSTNKKTAKEAKITNAKIDVATKGVSDKVDDVQKGVNGNLDQLNQRITTQTDKIDELHQKIETTAIQTEVDKAAALEKKG